MLLCVLSGNFTAALVVKTHVHTELCTPSCHTTPKSCNSLAQVQEHCILCMHQGVFTVGPHLPALIETR